MANRAIFMPHYMGGTLDEAVPNCKEFDSIDSMKKWLVDGNKGRDVFQYDDIEISEDNGGDERIGWENQFYVLLKRYSSVEFETPQCIGYCSTKYDKRRMRKYGKQSKEAEYV